MLCVAYSDCRPKKVNIEHDGKIVHIWIRKNITEESSEEGKQYRYDEAYMQADKEPKITEENFDEVFEAASEWQENKEASESIEDFLLSVAGEHEYRLCLLELGVEL